MSWQLAVKPRRVPLTADPTVQAKAMERLRGCGSSSRYAAMVGVFEHVFDVLAVEQQPQEVKRHIREALAWLAADAELAQEDKLTEVAS